MSAHVALIFFLGVRAAALNSRCGLLLEPNLADLDDRRDVGVFWDIALEDVGVGEKGICERLDSFASEAADRRERRQLVWSSAEHADLNGNRFHGGAKQPEHEGYVRIDVVVDVEVSAGLARIENRNLDHRSTIRCCGPQSG